MPSLQYSIGLGVVWRRADFSCSVGLGQGGEEGGLELRLLVRRYCEWRAKSSDPVAVKSKGYSFSLHVP